jgi:hypothetical protein
MTPEQAFPNSGPRSSNITLTTANITRGSPSIWVAFKDDVVVNIRRFGGHDESDKTGSLGG